jgi:hypothetical protein
MMLLICSCLVDNVSSNPLKFATQNLTTSLRTLKENQCSELLGTLTQKQCQTGNVPVDDGIDRSTSGYSMLPYEHHIPCQKRLTRLVLI